MTETSPVFLLDRATRKLRDAIFVDDVPPELVSQVQSAWSPHFAGSTAEHGHWDWNKKYELVEQAPLVYRVFGIVVDEEMQGLMLVSTAGKNCRETSQNGKPLVYIEYLATAPWNSADIVAEPRFSGVGKIFIRAAIELSLEEEFGGRIGLHSLPQAETWYRDVCGMTDLGADTKYQGLHYFEMTPQQIEAFMRG